MTAALDRVYDALERAGCEPKRRGDRIEARCPLAEEHRNGDRKPSFSAEPAEKFPGVVIACVNVHTSKAGRERMLRRLGLVPDDAEPGTPAVFRNLRDDATPNGRMRRGAAGRATTSEPESPEPPAPPPEPPPPKKRLSRGWLTPEEAAAWQLDLLHKDPAFGPTWRLVNIFAYSPTFAVARFEPVPRGPDRLKDLRPINRGDDARWRIGDAPGLLPLYGAAELCADQAVFVAEGEPKVDLLRTLGLHAVSGSHGGKSAHKSDWTALAGRTVYALPDNDRVGAQHARDVAAILAAMKPPAIVKVVELPGLEPGQDVADLIDQQRADGREDGAIKRFILDLAAAAPPWTPPTAPEGASSDLTAPDGRPTKRDAQDLLDRIKVSNADLETRAHETWELVARYVDDGYAAAMEISNPVTWLAACLDRDKSYVSRLLDFGREVRKLKGTHVANLATRLPESVLRPLARLEAPVKVKADVLAGAKVRADAEAEQKSRESGKAKRSRLVHRHVRAEIKARGLLPIGNKKPRPRPDLRPAPDNPRRRIVNWLHAAIAEIAESRDGADFRRALEAAVPAGEAWAERRA